MEALRERAHPVQPKRIAIAVPPHALAVGNVAPVGHKQSARSRRIVRVRPKTRYVNLGHARDATSRRMAPDEQMRAPVDLSAADASVSSHRVEFGRQANR